MDNKEIIELARKAYEYVYNQSEDVIVRDAISKYSDNDEIADYVESYQNIFKEGWVNFVAFKGHINSYLSDEDRVSFQKLEQILSSDFQIEQITNEKIGTVYKYIRPIEGHESYSHHENAETKAILPTLTDEDRKRLISEIRKAAQSHEGHWISLVDLGAALKSSFDYKSKGYLKLSDLLSQLLDYIELRVESPVRIFVHVIGDNAPVGGGTEVDISSISKDEKKVLELLEKAISEGQADGDGWLKTTVLGLSLKRNGIDYKVLGFPKLKNYLESLKFVELKQTSPTDLYARINSKGKTTDSSQKVDSVSTEKISPYERITKYAYFPAKDKETNGFTLMLQELESKAKKENWEYGNQKILQNYLLYTFERILYEDSRINDTKDSMQFLILV